MGTLLPPIRAPLLKTPTGSADPLPHSRTQPHLRSAPSATVEQEKPDTARRPSGDSTTSGQINRTIIPPNAEESQLSSSRTGLEPRAPLGPRKRPSGAARVPSGHFSRMSDGVTMPGSVGPDSSRAPGAQCSRNSALPAPRIITDGSAPSVFDPTLEYSTEQVVLFWQPPACFSQWSPEITVAAGGGQAIQQTSCVEPFLSIDRRTIRKISVPTLTLYEIHHIAFTHVFMVTSRSPSG